MDCNEIKTQYQKIKTKQANFHALALDLRTNRASLVAIKKEIQSLLVWFEKNLPPRWQIRLRGQCNPFAEVYQSNKQSIPNREVTIIDLKKQLLEDTQVYNNCDLATWTDAIRNYMGKQLNKISAEKQKIIIQELRAGAIPIFMPGRIVQYENFYNTLRDSLIPVFISPGKKAQTMGASVELVAREFFDYIEQHQSVDVPEKPYILLVKPTNHADIKDIPMQNMENAIRQENIKRKKKQKEPVSQMMPMEYATMVKVFTERAVQMGFQSIYPPGFNAHTQFINRQVAAEDVILTGFFTDLLGGNMNFFAGSSSGLESCNIRIVVRVLF